MGRKQIPLDHEQVVKLSALGCTADEIASFFGVGRSLLFDRYSDALYEGRQRLNISLRRAQVRNALKGRSDRMLIWLGKQYLGQREPIDAKLISDDDILANARRYFAPVQGAGAGGEGGEDRQNDGEPDSHPE